MLCELYSFYAIIGAMKRQQNVNTKLAELIAIESVSADPARLPEVMNAAAYIKNWLVEIGFDVKMVEKSKSPPLIVATYTVPNAASTIGIYAHYDVQAEDPIEEWHTAPFTVIEKNGKLWGRGVADDKGHVVQNIAAVEELVKESKLRNNIIFIFEGEEETGSYSLLEFLEQAAPQLQHCDFFMILDAGMKTPQIPMIEYALRGLVYFELTITTAGRDLHSGLYGNAVPNPANILTSLLGGMKDSITNEVLIPGFYDDVRALDKKERTLLEKNKTTDKELKEEIQGKYVRKMRDFPSYLSPKVLPSLDINGMISGYTGEGPKTIIPRSATVKFSIRLVENQRAEKMQTLIEKYIKKHMPKDVTYDLKILSSDEPFYTDFRSKPVQQVAKVLKEHFGNDVIYNRSGGSIPAAEMFQRLYNKPIMITGFTLPDENLHAPNENIDSKLFKEGITVLKKIFSLPFAL